MLDRQVIVCLICLLYPPGRRSCSWQSIQFQWLWHGPLPPSQRRHSSQGYTTQPTPGTTKGFRVHQKEVCRPCKKDWYNIPCCVPTRLPHFQHLLLDYIQNYTAWGHSQEIGNSGSPGLLSQSDPHVNKQWNVFLSYGLRISSPLSQNTGEKISKEEKKCRRKSDSVTKYAVRPVKRLPLCTPSVFFQIQHWSDTYNWGQILPSFITKILPSEQKRIRKQTILLKHLSRDCGGYSTVSYKRTKIFQDNVAFLFETSLLSYIPWPCL